MSRQVREDYNAVNNAREAILNDTGLEPSNQEIADYVNQNRRSTQQIGPQRVSDVIETIEASRGRVSDVTEEGQSLLEETAPEGTRRGRTNFRSILPKAGLKRLQREVNDDIASGLSDAKVRQNVLEAIKGNKLHEVMGPKEISKLIANNIKDFERVLPDLPSAATPAFIYQNYFGPNVKNKKDTQRKIRSAIADGIVSELERPLGKQTTPSQELEFSIEEGSATRVTDTGAKASKQVNSHGQDWKTTADELNNTIKKTDFDNDWVQWSPGVLDTARGLAKGMSRSRIMELQKQPGRVAKIATKHGLKLRSDMWNPGVYHIYKPGKPGSPNIEAQYDGWEALERANPNYINIVSEALQKAWPNIKIANTPEAIRRAARELGIPATRVKGAYVIGENTVLINPGMATYDTPIHEFAHIWEKQLQIENPELWKRGVELLKGSEFMRAVDSIPAYREYRKTGQLNRFYGEVMANAIGKRGYQIFGSKRAAGTWDSWMNDFTNWFKKKLGISTDKPYDQMTLDDWLETAVHGVFTGTTPNKIDSASQAIEYSLGTPQGKTTAEIALEKEQAAKAAARAPKGNWFDRATSWLVGPAADDYHGLVQRFKSKFKNDPIGKKFDNLTKSYVDGYQEFEKAATTVRERFAEAGDKLANQLNLKVSRFAKAIGDTPRGKLDNYLAQDSDVSYKGVPLSYHQALQVYTNQGDYDANLVDQVKNTIPKEMLDFADSLPFSIEGTIQGSLLNHINKNVFKDTMKPFLDYKAKNFDKSDLLTLLELKWVKDIKMH